MRKRPIPRSNPARAAVGRPFPASLRTRAGAVAPPRFSTCPNLQPPAPIALAHPKRQLRSLAQGLDLHLSAPTRQTGAAAPASGANPQQPLRPHPRGVLPRGGSSRRVAGTPSAAAAMPGPARLPVLGRLRVRTASAPPLCLLAAPLLCSSRLR